MSTAFRRIIAYLENPEIPFANFILTFFAATSVRNLLEQFLISNAVQQDLQAHFFHYYLSYACIALSFIILLNIMTGEAVTKISRVVLPSFIVLNIVPLIDLVFSAQGGYTIGYFFPDDPVPLGARFLTFFGPLTDSFSGVTPGIRVELVLVLIASAFYFSIKGLSWIRNLVGCILVYALVFFYFALPCTIKSFLGLLGIDVSFNVRLLIDFHLFLSFYLVFGVAFLAQRQYWLALFKDLRVWRVLHYELMFLIGLGLAAQYGQGHQALWGQEYFFQIIFTVFAILLGWMFSLTTNNLSDMTGDALSSPDRPTVSGAVPLGLYRGLPWFFLAGAFIYSWMVNFSAFFAIAIYISVYYLYSMPPFRFKRVPVLSKFFIVFNSLLLIALGFYLQSGQEPQIASVSPGMFFFT